MLAFIGARVVCFFLAEQLLLRCMQPFAPSSTTPAIWKISQVQFHVFLLSTNTIASTNKGQLHCHLSPDPRAQREPFPFMLQSWPHMTHRKKIAMEASKVCLLFLPYLLLGRVYEDFYEQGSQTHNLFTPWYQPYSFPNHPKVSQF